MSKNIVGRMLLRVLLLALTPAVMAQEQPNSELPPISLQLVSSVTADSAPGLSLAVPLQCGPGTSVLVRFADAGQNAGFLAISADGRIVRFKPEPMGEAAQAAPISAFGSEDRVFVIYATTQVAGTAKMAVPLEGKTFEQTVPKQTVRFYIAEFEQDGRMADLLKLDLPFRPTRLGVFRSGAFLAVGFTADQQPKVALLRPDGQFDRFLHIADYDAKDVANGSTGELNMARADIVSDGHNLLLFHRRSRGPIIEVTAGGDIRVIKVQNIPEGFKLESVKPTESRWVVTLARSSEGHRYETRTYAVNRDDAVPIAEYAFDQPIGLGLACVRNGEFIGLRTDPKTYRPVITRWKAQ